MDHSTQIQFQVDLTGLLVFVAGVIACFVRMEMKGRQNEKDIENNKKTHDLDMTKLKNEVDTAISSHKAEQEKNQQAIWEKFETVHKTLLTMTGTLGKIEGKLDSHKQN